MRRLHGPLIVVIDASYTLKSVEKLGNWRVFTSRESPDTSVLSIHPGGDPSVPDEAAMPIGVRPKSSWLGPSHRYLEGRRHPADRRSRIGRSLSALGQILLIAGALRHARNFDVVEVRANDPSYCGLIGLVLSRTMRASFTVRVSGELDTVRSYVKGRPLYPTAFSSRRVEMQIETLVLKAAHRVVAPTQAYLDALASRIPKRASIEVEGFGPVIGRGFLDHARSGVEMVPRGSGTKTVLFVSRLEHAKRPKEIVEVAQALALLRRDFRILVAGDGTLRDALQSESHDRGLEGFLRFLGTQDQTELFNLYLEADVFAATQAGRALVEASLMALPSALYASDWHQELLLDGVSALFVPDGRPDDLAAALDVLLSDENLRRTLGLAARDEALKHCLRH